MKNNANYFSHDNNMRNDSKILLLRNKFGHEGYAFWCMLLEVICEKDNFQLKLSKDQNWEELSIDLRIDQDKLACLMEYLVKLGLVKKQRRVYKVPNLLERMRPLLDKRAKLKSFAESRERDSSGHFTQTSGKESQTNSSPTPQSKVKESKEIHCAKAQEKFSSKEYIKELLNSNQRHIHIIGLFWDYKKKEFDNIEQPRSQMKKLFRAAKDLKGYSDEQILAVFEEIDKESNYDKKDGVNGYVWTLSTIHKRLGNI